jgi:hypothetical protein
MPADRSAAPPAASVRGERSAVAVVIPVYRPRLEPDETLSLRHLDHYLPDADRYLLMPEGLDFARHGYRSVTFPARRFANVVAYNRLVLSKEFYARFAAYEFILIHQLDAILLKGGLQTFLDVDYLGAPFVDYDEDGKPYLSGVGNGGLSLRRVDAFRRLLDSKVPATPAREYFRTRYGDAPTADKAVGLGKAALKRMGIRNSVGWDIEDSLGNEDVYIAARASHFDPAFTFGTIERALAFAFEREPRYCFELSGGRLPLGAHAWGRYDRAFFEPYLLR